MALYEHVFIARQDISTQQVEGLQDMVSQILEENGGKVTKTEYWGLKSLSYRVKKNRKGHYSLMNIDASHEAVAEMQRRTGLSDDIIRHMTLRVDTHEDDESIQLRSKKHDNRHSHRDDNNAGGHRERRHHEGNERNERKA